MTFLQQAVEKHSLNEWTALLDVANYERVFNDSEQATFVSRWGITMQKLAIAAALVVVSLATLHGANAADMSARPMAYTPPPPPPPVFSWTGFYIGANGGGGSSHNNFNGSQTGATTFAFLPGVAFPSTTGFGGSVDNAGGIAGGQIGFNYEFPL